MTKIERPCTAKHKGHNQNQHACFVPCPAVAVNALESILGRYLNDRTRQRAALQDAQEALAALCCAAPMRQRLKAQKRLERVKARLANTEHVLQVATAIYQQHQEAVLCSAVM